MKIRVSALALSVIFLCTALFGCAEDGERQYVGFLGKAEESEEVTASPEDAVEFPEVWHADISFDDMEYVHYEEEWLEEYIDPIYELAENGGTEEEFRLADEALNKEMAHINTMYSLISIDSYADVNDEYASQEVLYAEDMVYHSRDAFKLVMCTLATSPYSDLMEGVYDSERIEEFAEYEETEEDRELADIWARESELTQEYYSLINQWRPDYERIGEIYVELVEIRNREAVLSGYDTYAEYAYDSFYAKDYTPEQAQIFWEGARTCFVPLMEEYDAPVGSTTRRMESRGELDYSSEAVLDVMDTVIFRISPKLHEVFEYMVDYGLYNIGMEDERAYIGFSTVLYAYNQPFIFNTATDTWRDYSDMFHEFGHFANFYYTESDMLYGVSDLDLSEVQSQGLEVLATFYYQDLFGEENADAIHDALLFSLVSSIVSGAMYDEFQQRIYAEPHLTPERANEIFAELYVEYGLQTYPGYEREWMYVSHNFDSPFYYISYGISALGALEIYDLAREDLNAGIETYLRLLVMDSEEYYYSEALEEVGFKDIFNMESYEVIAATVDGALSLPGREKEEIIPAA